MSQPGPAINLRTASAVALPESAGSWSKMDPIRWIPRDASAVLDIGCNVGELLSYCAELYPGMHLAGIEVNQAAVEETRKRIPLADVRHAGAEKLPFADASFDCVTMIEVLEHVPEHLRRQSLAEIKRVLRPGGLAIVRVPHAGLFAWLDSNNFRFRAPRLYGLLVGSGRRDTGYGSSEAVVWHHHFSEGELLDLAGAGWSREHSCMGGLVLTPLMGILCWPFYRTRKTNNSIFKTLARISAFDLGLSYGKFSYDLLVILRRR